MIIIRKDDETNYKELVKSFGGQVISLKGNRQTEMLFNGTLFKIGDLVRTLPCWYTTAEEIRQGKIIGFSHFEYKGEMITSVGIELFDGTFDKTHPSNIEKIDDSWLELC